MNVRYLILNIMNIHLGIFKPLSQVGLKRRGLRGFRFMILRLPD